MYFALRDHSDIEIQEQVARLLAGMSHKISLKDMESFDLHRSVRSCLFKTFCLKLNVDR
jgi:hypothetical protein